MSDTEFELRAKVAGLSERLARAQAEAARVGLDRRADVEAVRALHHVAPGTWYDTRTGEFSDACNGCGELWPCKTTRALDGIPKAAAGGDAA